MGCSSNSTKKKAEKEKEYSAIENVVARTSSEKYNLVKCEGKCGIYDVDEVEILPLRYDEILCTIEDGNNDFFIVELDGKKEFFYHMKLHLFLSNLIIYIMMMGCIRVSLKLN